MAGRGRGRGKSFSFNVEALGFGRGETLPGPIQQPPPQFPPLDFKPVPLLEDDRYTYLMALKQEFRGTVKELPYYLQPQEKKKDIERYSDKYQTTPQDSNGDWEPDWRRLPAELKIKSKKRKSLSSQTPNMSSARKAKPEVDIAKTLEVLEKKEAVAGEAVAGEEEEEKEGDKEGEDAAEEEYYEEEDMEEETDYNLTYFDNGELYGNDDEEDTLEDGPVY